MLQCFREVGYKQGFTTEIRYKRYNVYVVNSEDLLVAY